MNIVDPGSSSLCASSLDSGDENLVEPSSSELISSGVADMVMGGASDYRKRALVEVSSDGESVLLWSSLSFRCANKRESAKFRLPLRLLPLPGPYGL